MVDKFNFLNECLDDETLDYIASGLNRYGDSKIRSAKESVLQEICNILGVETLEGQEYEHTIMGVFKPFREIIVNYIDAKNASISSRFKRLLKSIIFSTSYVGDDNGEEIEGSYSYADETSNLFKNITSIDSLFSSLYEWATGASTKLLALSARVIAGNNASDLFPYFFLSILGSQYPKWLSVSSKTINEGLLTKQSLMAEDVFKRWELRLQNAFTDQRQRNRFQRFLFLVSIIEVLRIEYSHLNCELSLEEAFSDLKLPTEEPIMLPSYSSSSFVGKIFKVLPKGNPFENCAAIIIGVYQKTGFVDHNVDELISLQIKGNDERNLNSIKPLEFSSWQAKILVEKQSLNPLFAIISSLKFPNPTAKAREYFDFKEYTIDDRLKLKDKYTGTLYLEHFFPYVELSRKDIVKADGNPEITVSEWKYSPQVKAGICIDLIEKIYMIFSGVEASALLPFHKISGNFSFIQSANLDDKFLGNYHNFLSPTGRWRTVKSKFDADLEFRVKEAISLIRHDIGHYLGPIRDRAELMATDLASADLCDINLFRKFVEDTYRYALIAIRILKYDITGLESANPNLLPWNESIKRMLTEMPNLSSRIDIEYDNGNVADNLKFKFLSNGTYFAQMIQNILKNADDHGFKLAYIPNPKIKIESSINDDILTMSFKNNGSPLNEGMTIDKFRTSGISGNPGNTGLGGAQIDRIIRAHGGKIINISSNEDWNFILDIQFKINEQEDDKNYLV